MAGVPPSPPSFPAAVCASFFRSSAEKSVPDDRHAFVGCVPEADRKKKKKREVRPWLSRRTYAVNGIKDGFEYFSVSYRGVFDVLTGSVDTGQRIYIV